MYKSINDAHTALVNSGVFEMFNFDVIIIDNVVGYMWINDKTPLEAAVHFGVLGDDTSLVPTRKDDNWNDGKTTIWFEDVSTNDGEILGVVFEGCSDPVLVDVNGEPVDNPAILGSILEAARAAVVNL
ncbi:MAG: hypothetical protein RBR22_09735 [Desulfuromonas sp.]|nr:hypothetical protein [Desulfuromonas sp.]